MNGGDYFTKNCPKCNTRMSINEDWKHAECDCGAFLRDSMQLNEKGSRYMVIEIEENQTEKGGSNA